MMHLDKRLRDQFIAPDGSNRENMEQVILETARRLLDFLSRAAAKPVMPSLQHRDTDHFPIPEDAQTAVHLQEAVQALCDLSMNPGNPQYIGHMDSVPAIWSVMGDLVAAALNNNLLSLEMSPFMTRLEHSLTTQFASLFGMPETAGGVMLSGGTLSNMQALVTARNTKLNIRNGNVFSLKKEPVLFVSEHAHTSIMKAAMMTGIGTDNVIKVKTDQDSRMNMTELEQQIREQLRLGKQPFALVATAGTTVTGSIDPLDEMTVLAAKYNLWLHVDAIYGGALVFSGRYAHLLKGIGEADSVAFNPQKWMYVAKTCSMVLFKDVKGMADHFRTAAPYMKAQSLYVNLGEISLQGSKQASVTKLWLSLLSIGKNGYRELVEYGIYLKEKFEGEIGKRPYLKLAGGCHLNILCFRGEPAHLDKKEFDRWNEELQQYLMQKANFFLSLPTYKNGLWLRAVLLHPYLTPDHIEALFDAMDSYFSASV